MKLRDRILGRMIARFIKSVDNSETCAHCGSTSVYLEKRESKNEETYRCFECGRKSYALDLEEIKTMRQELIKRREPT